MIQGDQLLSKFRRASIPFLGRWRDNSGASIVEFALLVPFLLTLTIGIAEMSNVFFIRTALNEVVRDAARRFAVGALDKIQTEQLVLQKVAETIDTTGEVQVTETEEGGEENGSSSSASNDEVTVVLTVSLQDLLLFETLGGVVTFGGANTKLTFSATMLKY